MEPLIQFDMFKETTSEDILRAELAALKESHNKVRKSTFARLGELTKLYLRQQEELDFLKVKMGLSCIVERPRELEKTKEQKNGD